MVKVGGGFSGPEDRGVRTPRLGPVYVMGDVSPVSLRHGEQNSPRMYIHYSDLNPRYHRRPDTGTDDGGRSSWRMPTAIMLLRLRPHFFTSVDAVPARIIVRRPNPTFGVAAGPGLLVSD